MSKNKKINFEDDELIKRKDINMKFNKNNNKKSKVNKKEKVKSSKRKKIIIICSLLMCFIVVTALLYVLVFNKKIYLKGFIPEDKVLVNTEYKEKDFSICYGTIVNCNKVEVERVDDIDINKLGEYTITYRYKAGKKNEELKKKVIVYDDIKPEIVIDSELSFCKDGKVGSGKYHVTDNYDDDLTDKVEFNIEGDKSYLSVSDSSGNINSIEVAALEFTGDPSITLNGDATMYIYQGEKYTEPGASAIDVCDGDISDKIEISGSVNNNTASTYTINYKVENSSGKTASVSRVVKVIKRNQTIYPGDKKIYLTFDDGPGPYTTKLLDILDKYGVKATFFVTNQFGNSYYQSLIGEEARRGHVVAIHSYTHNFNIYRSIDSYFNDLNKMNDLIEKQTGSRSKYVRFPGGSSNTISRTYASGIMTSISRELTNRGFSYYDWNLDSCDTNSATTKTGVKNCTINQLRGGTYMVLMHDIKPYTVEAVDEIIPYALENGYSFLTITDTTPTFHQAIAN